MRLDLALLFRAKQSERQELAANPRQEQTALEMRLAAAKAKIDHLQAHIAELERKNTSLQNSQRSIRHDLNGLRLTGSENRIWLVLNGRRRRCDNPKVYSKIFREDTALTTIDDVDDIVEDSELVQGTCLIKSIDDGIIYLVANGEKCILHRVSNFDTFVLHGFDLDKIYLVPSCVIALCPMGRML